MSGKPTVCIVGLGYVGLPLAHAFAKAGVRTLGYDIDVKRIEALKNGRDQTGEFRPGELVPVSIAFSSDPGVIADVGVVILAIPTPVDRGNKPDLSLLMEATETVAERVQDGAIVVYESTVYPGVTEELCGPVLKAKKTVKLGYSPERINPGDKEHTIDKIVKVVAAEDEETLETLAALYGRIVPAGIHRAESIRVAEMAKAIENAQRDLNIAYINEVAKMCNALGIATKDVLSAAGTKWNFLREFRPGLVGGHCIGVDPYYLLEKANELNVGMDIVTAARKTNDGMAAYVVEGLRRALPSHPHVLILGLTFKENIPDTRNSKAGEVVALLKEKGCEISVHDPHVENSTALKKRGAYDAIALLVPHREYLAMTPEEFAKLGKAGCLFYDLKSVFKKEDIGNTGLTYAAL